MCDMAEVKFSLRAYCKMVLHAAKYPHCAVNGVLLADDPKSKKGKGLLFVDAMPLFHLCLHVSPMAEIALTQIDEMATEKGLVIAGYYQANENFRDLSSDKVATHRIADKIADNFSGACLVIVDNRRLSINMENTALCVSQYCDGKWKSKEKSAVVLEQDEDCLQTAATLLQREVYEDLFDFDNHLDDISRDWKNLHINKAVKESLKSW